jgi:nitroreductase
MDIAEVESEEIEETKLKPPESGADFNPVEDVIYRRRSVRYYRRKQVPEYLIRRILEAGRFAPSAGNAQTWKFIVVRDQTMIRDMTADIVDACKRGMKLADYTKPGREKRKWIADALMRLRTNEFHPVPFGAMKLISEGELGVWHGAPTVILMLADTRTPGDPCIDIGIAGQNMVLVAHSYGLGTCWVSFCKPLSYTSKWKKRLGLRTPYRLITSLAIGFPRGNPDGYVTRETQAIDWFGSDGTFKVLY